MRTPRALYARIKERYWGLLVMLLWGAVLLSAGLLRLDPYGVSEAGARALLLAWSVGEHVISTVFVLGAPDLRALLFLPLGLYWPGSILAAKVFQLLAAFAAATLLYKWSRRGLGAEAALIATGLLLVAPVTVAQSDTLGAGPYLLLAFGLGHWMDRAYRASARPLGGWYFLQLLLVIAAVSLHPAALAYPLALLWMWYRHPVDARQQRHFYIGVAAALIFVLALRLGWHPMNWLSNPLQSLAAAAIGREATGEALPLIVGLVLAGILIYLLIAERRAAATDLMRLALLGGTLLGALAADEAWSMVALAAVLYLGVPRLIAFNELLGGQGLARRRGVVLAVLFFTALLFTQADKAHQQAIAQNLLPPTDQLMLTLALELEDAKDTNVVVMSQWPGKTMLAIKRPALPLPPPYPDSATLLKNIRGVTHLVFNPFAPGNQQLSANLASAPGATETVALEEGGVIVRIKQVGGRSEE